MIAQNDLGEPPWPTRADTTIETVQAMQAGLTVDLIMTPRSKLRTCSPNDCIDSLKDANRDQFSFLPVVEAGLITGLYHAEQWFDKTPPPGRSIGDDFERLKGLTEDYLIGSNASILAFIKTGVKRPARLVVSGTEIVGLVCMADLHKLAVRAALFSVVTALEMAMADRIADEWQDNGWLNLLSDTRREKVEGWICEAKRNDTYVSDIASTQFADKATIVLKQGLVCSKSSLRKDFKAIRKLRDPLAHANDYASTPALAKSVSRTVNTALCFMNQLRSGSRCCRASPTC